MDDIGKLIFMGFYTPLVQKSQIINICIADPHTLFIGPESDHWEFLSVTH